MKKSVIGLILVVILAFVAYKYLDSTNYFKVNSIEKEGKLIEKHNLCDIYTYDGRIWYLWKEYPNLIDSNRFFIHIYPIDTNDLPEVRKPHGTDNLDFQASEENKLPVSSPCKYKTVIYTNLPTYKFKQLQTGMYNEKQRLWESKLVDF